MTTKTYKFKKGDRPHLDEVYKILALIPAEYYFQYDVMVNNVVLDNDDYDAGESITILRDFSVAITVKP